MIELAPGKLVFAMAPGFSGDPAPELRDALLQTTGERWQVEAGEGEGAPALREVAEALKSEQDRQLRETPLVKAAFAAFPAGRTGCG